MDFRQELSELMKKDDKDSFWKLLRLLQQIVASIDKNVDGKVDNLSGKISKSEESAIALYRDVDSRLKDISNVCSDIIDARKLLAKKDDVVSLERQLEKKIHEIKELLDKNSKKLLDKKAILDIARSILPEVKDGYTPVKGRDYFDGKNGSPDTAQEILRKLLTLKREDLANLTVQKKLSIKDIEGLESEIKRVRDSVVRRHGGGGASSFVKLDDVPQSYSGQASKVVVVKADETGLEFVTPQSIEDVNWGEIGGTLGDQTDLQGALDLKADDTDLAAYVPYIGATTDVDLGDHSLTTGGTASGQSVIDKGLVVNEGGYGDADSDFRAETDSNPNAFVVDASADEVTFGVDTYFTAGGFPYGSMYIYNLGAGTLTITVSAADTWYEIGSGVTGGTTNLITFQNNHELKILKAGTYKIDWALSIETASANQEIEGTVMINGTANTSFAGMAETVTANKPNLISGTGFVSLAANDVISLAVLNHSGATNIKIDHLTLSITMVGG